MSSITLLHGANLWDLSCPFVQGFHRPRTDYWRNIWSCPWVHPSPTTKQHKASIFVTCFQCFKKTSNLPFNEVNEPIMHSEGSQKEKNKYHINTNIQTLERWYWWTYLQGSNGDTDIENRHVHGGGGEGGGGTSGESSMEAYTLPYAK